ncbi:hypothetical protein [Rathayibacter sp. AY1D1]|uniref:hypothetical protein n=1 Tax=Rathayibacter sp. AY1D1 TaxID=2080542 RepID=UPI0015E353BD|nr:hypothetical protein [Rathayibacter sp. AY1D1]
MTREPEVLRVLGLFLKHSTLRLAPGEPFARGRLPYRADLLRDDSTRLLVPGHASRPAHVKLRDVVEHRTGLNVDTQLRALRAVRSADAVLCVLEPEAGLPALLRRARLGPYGRTPLVVLSCWWAEELLTGSPERRRQVVRLLQGVDRLVVLSENQREVFARHGVDERRIAPVLFGLTPTTTGPFRRVRSGSRCSPSVSTAGATSTRWSPPPSACRTGGSTS